MLIGKLVKKVIYIIIILLVSIGIATVMIDNAQQKKTLPILNPCNVNPTLVDVTIKSKCIGHKIGAFSFINQNGTTITQESIKNKIAVVDYFFVSCPSICPVMTSQLKRVHDYDFGFHNKEVVLLSHTVWPEADSVSVLKEYANRYDANPSKWSFLTGDKKELYMMARKNYLIVPDINDSTFKHGGETDFIHTENVVLIDRKGQIRGFYDGTSPAEISELIADIEFLLSSI